MTRPQPPLEPLARRQPLAVLAALALGMALAIPMGLTGCASQPPPAPAAPAPRFSPTQVTVLQRLGFAEITEGWELNLAGKVLFGFNDERLGADGLRTIADIAEALLKEDLTRLRIEGHADNIGDEAYNRRLSTRRAEVVAREFATRGLPASRIEVRGIGSAVPVADNTTEAGRAQNRRVTVLVRGD
ncbi:OmpA family protein [Sphaerotilus sp.]|uniref:OmpA family protein n=1 Tax=Sphaerotilus sp. TaxID=2093942 RepID=UPI002ACE681B|nr:OmpA family protein [Sphaerotilus sp.]MDZ7854827.1 OmpA family protein [Sphaerotilus sp.]